MGSLIFVVVYEILFPDQRLNLGSLHWDCGVLATGPPWRTLVYVMKSSFRLLCEDRFRQVEVEARSSGHVLEAVVFERDVASWVVRDDKSGDGRQ